MLPLLGVRTILLFVYVSACWESDRSYDLLCSLWEPAGFGGLESTLIFWHPMLGDNSVMTGPWSLMYSSSKSRYASERGRLRWLSTWDLVIRLASDLASGGSFASSWTHHRLPRWSSDPHGPWSVRVSWGGRYTWDEIEHINLQFGTFNAEELLFILDWKSGSRLILPPIMYFSPSLYNLLGINT